MTKEQSGLSDAVVEPRLEDLVRQSAHRAPDREALRIGAHRVSYRELISTADRWASVLRSAHSAGEPRRIAVLADRTFTGYVGILACMCAGAAVYPIAPDLPVARLSELLRDHPMDALLTDTVCAAKVKELSENDIDALPTVFAPEVSDSVWSDSDVTLLAKVDATDLPARQNAGDVAYVLFTSGSTGRPKGVPIRHANACHFIAGVMSRYEFTEKDVFSQTFGLTFDLAFFDLFAAWASGGTVVHTHPAALARLPQFVEREGITVWFSVPGTVSALRRSGGLPEGSLPSLRWSLFCGEALLHQDAAAWQMAAANATLENLYGPTELTIACTAYRWAPSNPVAAAHGVVPIGELFPGHDAVLLDETGELDPHEGELCVTGPQMFSGYLQAEDDVGRFLRRDGRCWYRTGDLVRRSGGAGFLYLGRTDHQIKVRGYRIEPGEIEQRLRVVPGVEEAVVLAVGAAADRRLVAFCGGNALDAPQIDKRLREELPPYLIPSQYILLSQLPVTDRGKVDRRALVAMALA
ncbi:amino acid adenylation domain-containing protein [Streptomyces sp. ME19-01-6]|uniref:amino acid adenylation domain-containing protein n=1 Tax=Streptomyces sp. ME19-01-6 TaxID=3028686 RepID=UPI0029AD9EA9|nr:amino acid adenylation domain-containing protein [Streptomyces sp. ME19-01-6]MDX3225227.1 amino acid adenylation domain-containing protein [Streptomyces sp. ME19-01-6]